TEGEQAAAPAPPPAANPMAVPPGGETEVAVAPPAKSEAEPAAPVAPAPSAAPAERGLGWRTEKLGVLALKGVDADVDLTLDQFVYEKIRIDSGRVKAALSGGKLSLNAPNLKAYGGGGSLALSIDASGAVPVHRVTLALAGLDAYPFLRDVAEFQTIEGKAA